MLRCYNVSVLKLLTAHFLRENIVSVDKNSLVLGLLVKMADR